MSGLRRLCDPARDAEDPCRHRGRAGEHGLRFRYRMRVAFPLLHGDLWLPYDPRPGAGRGHGHQNRQPGARRLGGDGRRRRSVDRRQSPAARAQAQCRHADSAFQQRDLRPHQGSVLADFAYRHPFAVDPHGIDRASDLGGRIRSWCRCPFRRPVYRLAAETSAPDVPSRP